jgi:hypothetical protein
LSRSVVFNRPPWVDRRQELDESLARSPLVEIVFDDERLRTSSSARSG